MDHDAQARVGERPPRAGERPPRAGKRARATSPSPAPAASCTPPTWASPGVSVVMPAHNAEAHLDACLRGLSLQTHQGPIEVSVRLDGCSDGSLAKCEEWRDRLAKEDPRFSFVLSASERCEGVGAARNAAIRQSRFDFLCTHDADDVSEPTRISSQLEACCGSSGSSSSSTATGDSGGSSSGNGGGDAIVGARFTRIPADATERYARWLNGLDQDGLWQQRFRELTVIQPTWFFHRKVWERLGGYVERVPVRPAGEASKAPNSQEAPNKSSSGGPVAAGASSESGGGGATEVALAEDLRFFYAHLRWCEERAVRGAQALAVVDAPLVQYRHVGGSVSSKTPRRVLFEIKVRAMEESVLGGARWERFTIWNAGRDGKRFFNLLRPEFQRRVAGFCDIDPAKIAAGYRNHASGEERSVVHFSEAKAPIVCCVAMDRDGQFERNLASLGLEEGSDYLHFI